MVGPRPEKRPLLKPVASSTSQTIQEPEVETAPVPAPSSSRRTFLRILAQILVVYALYLFITSDFVDDAIGPWLGGGGPSAPTCVQAIRRAPKADKALDDNKAVVFSDEYREHSVKVHSGLVRVHSESFDDLGPVGNDSRWDVFYDVEKYLAVTFPLLHKKLHLEKVNTHGLVYVWEGTDTSLKPALLAAHQDTVPVNPATLDYWTYPPWSGKYDGKYVYVPSSPTSLCVPELTLPLLLDFRWGRGASDCKNTLSGILEAVTLLLEGGFEPKRTVILAFGFDEESKGYEGAGTIATYLEETYGKDGIAFILDEGGLGIGEQYGTGFALPATGEKGYLDVNMQLHTPGGHSSIPPPHTGIGIISNIVQSLESAPYSPSLSTQSPIFSLLQCAAEHGELASNLKANVRAGARPGGKGDKARMRAAKLFADIGRPQQYLVSTSQAVDVISGGVKVNALPELTNVVVNYRISVDSHTDEIINRVKQHVLPIAKQYGLELDAFGEKISFTLDDGSVGGQLLITGINELQPAPVTSIATEQWDVLSSTIQHVYADNFSEGFVVSPCVMTGNTDTRFYWNLSKNIYRFTPMDRDGSKGIHTVDEHLLFDDHIAGIWFFHELLRRSDEAKF